MPVEISDELQSVAFICVERDVAGSSEIVPVGTAFFVLVPWSADQQIAWVYAITARHVLEESKSERILIRINRHSGAFEDLGTKRSDWLVHDQADVAAIRLVVDDFSVYDMKTVSLQSFVNVNYRYSDSRTQPALDFAVTVGQEVFFVGLFAQHYGSEQNLPIARFGNISRMPTKIRLPRWGGSGTFEMDAYLVESHSWGGQSGSPVFWLYPVSSVRMGPLGIGDFQVAKSVEHGYLQAFLGLVSAHFSTEEEAETEGDILGTIRTRLNTGIVVVTPAHSIKELLMQDDFAKERDRLVEEVRRGESSG